MKKHSPFKSFNQPANNQNSDDRSLFRTLNDDNSKRGRGRFPYVLIVGLLVCVFAGISYLHLRGDWTTGTGALLSADNAMTESDSGLDVKEQAAKLTAMLDDADRNAGEREAAAEKKFKHLMEKAAVHARCARRRVPRLVDEITTFKQCCYLCYLKCKGGDALDKYVRKKVGKVIAEDMAGGLKTTVKALEQLRQSLEESRTQTQTEIIQGAELLSGGDKVYVGLKEQFVGLNENIREISMQGLGDIAFSNVFAVGGLALEAVFIKTTITCIGRVLGHIAAKMGASASLAIFSAAADGPFPVGDAIGTVIAVGGSAWCVYDIHNAQNVLKPKLKRTITKQIDDFERRISSEAEKEAGRMLALCRNDRKKMIEELKLQIKEESK